MGLPLFVAPVESDLPSKSASKHGATSPSRSSIRRSGWRDTRVANARRGGLRLYGTVHPSLAATHDAQPESGDGPASSRRNAVRLYGHDMLYPAGTSSSSWGDAPLPPGFMPVDANEPIPRPFREALVDVSQIGERRRERLQEMLHAGLRSLNSSQPDDERPHEYLGWFSAEPEQQTEPSTRQRNAQLLRYMDQQYGRSPGASHPPADHAPPVASARDSSSDLREQIRSEASARRAWRQQGRSHGNHLGRRSLPPRRGVDGLGDRDRSLSPEVWDTLLSTLTPDPQPPSASSSFASAAASQTAAPSSTTTPPTVDADPLVDGPCESGCENSDGEDDEYDPSHQHRRPPRRRVVDEVGEYNFDGPADRPFARTTRRAGRDGSGRRPVGPDGPIGSSRQGSADDTTGAAGGVMPLSRLLHPAPRDGWVGQLSVGASDEEHGEDGARRDREESAGHNASGGDEDLSGMQRIIRSLSWRQDIPEEWWAEAGLRRTLPPDTELS